MAPVCHLTVLVIYMQAIFFKLRLIAQQHFIPDALGSYSLAQCIFSCLRIQFWITM
jgi:hypothetical protein